MALNTWEFSYNGLVFGGSNPHAIIDIEGLDPPDARVDEVEKAGDHGSFIFAQFLTARTMVISGDMAGSDAVDFEAKINQLRAAFAPQRTMQPLSMAVPGGAVKRIYCVPTKVDFPVDINYDAFYDTWTVELMAEDPRIYSDALNNRDLTPAIANGIGFNIGFNVNFGGTSGGGLTQSITNQGTFPTPIIAIIYGPVANPKLKNKTTGEQLSLDISLAATEFVIVDFIAKTIVLNNLSSRYNSLMAGSTWWSLMPGINTVEFVGDGVTANTKATITYRDAWN